MSIRLFVLVAGVCLMALSLPVDGRPRGLISPGDRLFVAGLDAYEGGNHDAAYRYFMDASLWGIKDAQFNVGVMHYRGEGTEQDYVTAYAWFAIAAERGDDVRKSQIRDECYSLLNAEDQGRAFDATVELFDEYGDANTIGRVTRWYRKQRRNTGSRVGFSGGALTVFATGRSGATVPYNVVHWNATKFAGSLSLPEGFVEYGELGIVEDEDAGIDDDAAEAGDSEQRED